MESWNCLDEDTMPDSSSFYTCEDLHYATTDDDDKSCEDSVSNKLSHVMLEVSHRK
jgi:hypothetical protein